MSAADRARLEAIVADRNSPQKHVWRARIILATADGLRHRGGDAPGRGVEALRLALAGAVHGGGRGRPGARQDPAGTHAAVAQGRGRSGRARDAGRAARRDDPLDGAGDGRGQRASASARCSASGGRTGCDPTRSGASSCRPIPTFAAKLEDDRRPLRRSAGPQPGAARSTRSRQIQALDRTQPGLPLKPGRAGTMTHLCTSPAGQELS